ncbi:MAG: hypothetical protein LBT78_06860 [Tannerella sp.]|jgi:hypothetical protein|nr:hypothetical protein [Tannerella sp.]
MKKIILCLVLCAGLYDMQAQSLDHMPKRKAKSASPPALSPVSPPDSSSASGLRFIEEAVKDGFFILRQNYQLKDISANPPGYYGWNENPHFGTVYSLGIKTVNGFYSDDKVLYPWNYDSKYDAYRTDKKYEPVISETHYRSPAFANYETMHFFSDSCSLLADSRLVYTQNSVFGKKGFTVKNENGSKTGWIVWVASAKPLETSDTVSFAVCPAELTFEEGKRLYEVNDTVTGNREIAGGIFVVAEVTDIGQISYVLYGILSRNENKWQLVRMENGAGTRSKRE